MLLITLFIIFEIVFCNAFKFREVQVQQVSEPVDHGEGPIWDPRTKLLYFVDVYEGRILSYNYITKELSALNLHGKTSPIILTEIDHHVFVVGVERSIFAVEWDGHNNVSTNTHLVTVSEQFPTSRLNDGKADNKGRLWIGTMGFETPTGVVPNEGILYSISKKNLNNPLPMIQPVNISNGMAWNKNNDKFYYIDTPTLTIKEYNYNKENGVINNPKVIFDLSKHTDIFGFPDGMTIDIDDNLWVALVEGSLVIKVNPRTGDILQKITIPATRVTSVTWGGCNLNILFVTTSKHGLSPSQLSSQPAAGSLFAITNLGTHGLQTFYTNIVDEIS